VTAAAPGTPELDLSEVARLAEAVFHTESDLIPLLQKTQAHYGYLPEPVVMEMARVTGVPASRIHGVITFYAQFSTTPAGRHKVCVCQGTACHVRGAHEVLRSVEKELGIAPGQTTPDLSFQLETVACLGACSFSPVMTVDGQYFARMKGSRVPAVLHEFDGGPTAQASKGA
jgi:NADH:ubiquinone oxidoreductase subunit E